MLRESARGASEWQFRFGCFSRSTQRCPWIEEIERTTVGLSAVCGDSDCSRIRVLTSRRDPESEVGEARCMGDRGVRRSRSNWRCQGAVNGSRRSGVQAWLPRFSVKESWGADRGVVSRR